MYYVPLLLTILANILYHVFQKKMPENLHPLVAALVTYFVAFLLTFVFFIATRPVGELSAELKKVNLFPVLLGGAVILLDIVFLLAYRMHWQMNTASLVSTVVVSILLLPIGYLLFGECLNVKQFFGIVCCILGIFLLNGR